MDKQVSDALNGMNSYIQFLIAVGVRTATARFGDYQVRISVKELNNEQDELPLE